MPKRRKRIVLTEYDRKFLTEVGGSNITAFTRFYFDGWTPIPWQHQFYHAPQKRKLVVAGIRSGKTKIVAASFLYYMLLHPDCRVANASISADQANIVYYDCLELAERPRFKHWIEKVERHPYPSIKLVNGAEAWFRSIGYEAELWRGHEFDVINIDEAAYVTSVMAMKTLEGRLLGSYQNMLGKSVQRDGQLWMTTSPKGKTWVFERWKLGDPTYPGAQPDRYFSLRARTFENPHISPEALEELMAGWTQKMIDQELNGLFVDADGAQFSYEDVMAACTPVIRSQDGVLLDGREEVTLLQQQLQDFQRKHGASRSRQDDVDWYEFDPEPGHFYVNSWDVGKRPNKLGRNASVGGVLDITKRPWKLVAYRYAAGAPYSQTMQWIREWHQKYDEISACQTAIDASGRADVINEELQEKDRIDVEGIIYTAANKPLMIHSLALALERKWLVMPFVKRAVDQLQAYEIPDDKIAQDVVMMLAQACYMGRLRAGEVGKRGAVEKAVIATARHVMDHKAMDRMAQRRRMARSGRLPGRVGR